MDGKSAVLGDCQKIIVLFPPSSHNLRLMQAECRNQAKLARLMPRLEYGLIDTLNSSNIVFIPSGWAHATFTTRGGFLMSIDCATKTTVWTFSQYLKHHLYHELDAKQQNKCLFLFLDCLQHTITSYELVLASRSWCNVEDLLKGIVDNLWRRTASRIWHTAAEENPKALWDDGRGNKDMTTRQFGEQYLSWLDAEMIGLRRGRQALL